MLPNLSRRKFLASIAVTASSNLANLSIPAAAAAGVAKPRPSTRFIGQPASVRSIRIIME